MLSLSEHRSGLKKEVELGCHGEVDCPLLQVSASSFFFLLLFYSVFVTLFRTAVVRTSRGMHKLLGTGGVPTFLTFIVLAVADALFGFCGPERKDELFIGTQSRHPPPPSSRSLINRRWFRCTTNQSCCQTPAFSRRDR